MNPRYFLLASAYAERDRYVLILFGLAALILITEWATRNIRWLHIGYRLFLLAAFIGVALYGWAHPAQLP